MAKIGAVLHVEYKIVFFPFATWRRVGDLALLKIFGLPVYKRVGRSWWLIGYTHKAGGYDTP